MIPIGDSVKTRVFPVVNLGLVLVTALVFLYQLALGPQLDPFIRTWGVVPAQIIAAMAGDAPPQVAATLVTSQFLHGGWLHVGANMLFLWVFGRAVEDRMGHVLYLPLYLIWGVGAALAQVWVTGPSQVPMIGASGAVAGVLGAYFVLYPTAWVSLLVPILFFFWVIDVPAVLALAYWFAVQFLSGLATITTEGTATGGVAFWAHVGGFALGALTAPFFLRARPPAGPRSGVRSAQPWGPATPVVRVVSLATDLLIIALLARLGLRMLDVVPSGPTGPIVTIIYDVTWPLVAPFAELVPVILINGIVVELFTLLAVVVYAAAASLVIWLIGLGLRRR